MKKIRHATRVACVHINIIFLAAGTVYVLLVSRHVIAPCQLFADVAAVLPMVAMGALVLLVFIDALAAALVSTSTLHSTFIAASALLYHAFSADMCVYFLKIGLAADRTVFSCLHYAFFLLTVISLFVFWNYTYQLRIPRKHALSAYFLAAACAAGYVVASLFGVQYLVCFLSLAIIAPLFVLLNVRVCRAGRDNFNFYMTGFIMSLACGLALADTVCDAGFARVSEAGLASAYAFAVVFIYGMVYFYFIAGLDKRALKASRYRLQYETVKSQALRAQIKPHFVFNVLSSIKSLYRKDIESGDNAINLFSRHLRANVEALNVDFVPFEKELDSIQVFVALENFRREKPFNVVYDIDYADFDIPVLSLQPYVENAIKYSKVNEKENGYIRISSSETEKGILLEISDNGVGFDTGAVSPVSCGIRNARERFLLLVGTEPQIRSAPGEGTIVSIRMKKNAKEEFQNEDRYRR